MSPLQINQELEKTKTAIAAVLRTAEFKSSSTQFRVEWTKHVPASYKQTGYDVLGFLDKARKKIIAVHSALSFGGVAYDNELLQLYNDAAQKLQALSTAWTDNFETARTSEDPTYILAKSHHNKLLQGLHLFDNFKAMHEDLVAVGKKASGPGAPKPAPAQKDTVKSDDYWFRTAKIGDEYRGMHLAKIYEMGNEYIIFSSAEEPGRLHYYYADDTLGRRLQNIAVSLNAIKTLLEDHPQRTKYLPAVAQVYALAFNDNIPAATEAIADIRKKLEQPAGSDKKPPYFLIAAIGILLGASAIGAYLLWFRHESGPATLLTYLGLAFSGIAIAALINAITGSSLSIKGTIKGVEYNFTGPIVAVILCVTGYFYFVREGAASKTDTTFTVRVFNNNIPLNTGLVKLYITGLNLEPLPISSGQAIFSDIPREKLQQKITIYATASGFQSLSIDTIVGDRQDIRLNMIPLGIALDSAAAKKGKQVKKDSGTGKPSPKKHKLGDRYLGGIIFDLDADGEHGLIVAEQDQGIDVAWWIRATSITGNSYSLEDGYANTENIVEDQGNKGAYAASMCKNYRGGGFTDWFLPAIDQLKILYRQRRLVKNLKPRRYWSSTANGANACFLDFSITALAKDNSVDNPLVRYRVRAIRRF